MMVSKRNLLFQGAIFKFHVKTFGIGEGRGTLSLDGKSNTQRFCPTIPLKKPGHDTQMIQQFVYVCCFCFYYPPGD